MRLELTCLVYLLAILTSGLNKIVSGQIRAPKYEAVTTILIGLFDFLMIIQQLFTCLPSTPKAAAKHWAQHLNHPSPKIGLKDSITWSQPCDIRLHALVHLLERLAIALLVALLEA